MSRLSRYPRVAPLLLSLSLAVPASAAAQGIEEPRVPLRTAISEVNTVRSEYADAFNRKDAAALAAVYAPDATVILDDGEKLQGIDQIRAMLEADPSSWGHIVLASDTLRVYGNTAVDVGTMTVHPTGGGEEVSRYVAVLRRGMNGWRLVTVATVRDTPGQQASAE